MSRYTDKECAEESIGLPTCTKIKTGDLLYFQEEKRPYRVRACDERFVVATKHHFSTYLYTILDLHKKCRGPDDRVFGPLYDVNKEDEARECIKALNRGPDDEVDLEISYRNRIPIRLVKHKPAPTQPEQK